MRDQMHSVSETFRLWGRLLRHPGRVGAIAPSSRWLAGEMARGVGSDSRGVIELGGGTGRITTALLANGLPPTRLLVSEIDPEFAKGLSRRFAGIHIRNQPAQELDPAPLTAIDQVISGLPLLNFTPELQRAIFERMFAILEPGGRFVQFTYGPRVPVAPGLLDGLGLTARRRARIWANLPPATVYEITRR